MKKRCLHAIFLVLIPTLFCTTVFAQDARDLWIYQAKELELDVQTEMSLQTIKSRSDAVLERVEAQVSFYPKPLPHQRIIETEYSVEPVEENGTLTFVWDYPYEKTIPLSLRTLVRVKNNPIRVKGKVLFPLRNMPDDVQEYTNPAEIIDQNDDIVRLASELAAGEDDLSVIVDKIAAWTTQNIKYNLSTVNAEASLKASWVLAHREGVCDELTSLFIALLRSLRIPARFVAGISYTNSPQFDFQWGPHGWAEVYFPGYGWIPYDVTYGQYGFVDPTHVIAHTSTDAEKILTKFSWRGRYMTIKSRDFRTNVRITDRSGTVEPVVKIDIDLMKRYVGFGSHNLVEATVTNLKNYYQSFDVYLANTQGLLRITENKQHILLRPGEAKKVYWIVKTMPLEKGYQYTFPVLVYSVGDIRAQTNFSALEGGASIGREHIEETLARLDDHGRREFTKEVMFSCKAAKPFFYVDESGSVTCTLQNNGNVILEHMRLCVQNECKTGAVGITQSMALMHAVDLGTGITEIVATADGDGVLERTLLDLNVLDLPSAEFVDINAPASVTFDDEFSVRFSMRRVSVSVPQDLQVSFFLNGLPTQFHVEKLEGKHDFDVSARGDNLEEGANTLRLEAAWQDRRGQEYRAQEEVAILLENLTIGQKAYALLTKISNYLSKLINGSPQDL